MEGGGKNHLLTVSEDHADGEHRKLSRSISIREATQKGKKMLMSLKGIGSSKGIGAGGDFKSQHKLRKLWSRQWDSEPSKETLVKIILIQKLIRAYRARMLKRRLLVAHELMVTEEHYVKALSVLCRFFYEPLLALSKSDNKEAAPLKSTEDVESIFSVVAKLYIHHQEFSKYLRERVLDFDLFASKSLGDLFIQHTAFFELYSGYINNYDNSLATVQRCKKEIPKFFQFVEEAEAREECEYADLSSFLIQPIQRIPRYVMLLNALMRKTSKAHPCYEQLFKATQKIKDMTDYFNEQKKDSENADYVQKLYSQLEFDMPHGGAERQRSVKITFSLNEERRFVKEGDVMMIKDKNVSKPFPPSRSEDRHLILFNDVLLMCFTPTMKSVRPARVRRLSSSLNLSKTLRAKGSVEAMGNQIIIKEIIELWKVQVVDLPASYGEGVFLIQSFDCKYSLCAGTDKAKQEWFNALFTTIEKLFKKGATNPPPS